MKENNIIFSGCMIKPELESLVNMIEVMTNTKSNILEHNIFFHNENGKRIYVINYKYFYDMQYEVIVRKL